MDDKQLSDMLVKYRALLTAEQNYIRLRREVAEGFVALTENQKNSYLLAVERIDNEEQ
jgi:hypothetical protein